MDCVPFIGSPDAGHLLKLPNICQEQHVIVGNSFPVFLPSFSNTERCAPTVMPHTYHIHFALPGGDMRACSWLVISVLAVCYQPYPLKV